MGETMRVGMIGTGAISWKHAEAYKNIGYKITVCTNRNVETGHKFAAANDSQFLSSFEEVCRHPEVDYVDVCTLPNLRLEPIEICAQTKKHVLVQKPIAINLETARAMVDIARKGGIQLGVVSQHRFDDSIQFLKKAIADGRLGTIVEADAYVKWHRSAEYYSRPIKGSWEGEGGGCLINQAIHQVDLLLYLVGPVEQVYGNWQLGSVHKIESEDCLNAMLRFRSGATGVIQASTALWPGYPERIEIHGSKGTAIITGDKLTTWDVRGDRGEDAPIVSEVASGASDPMAISILPFERQLSDFGNACDTGKSPLVSGIEGLSALQLVTGIYDSCRNGLPVKISSEI
jgi:predicted dehydrogenase